MYRADWIAIVSRYSEYRFPLFELAKIPYTS